MFTERWGSLGGSDNKEFACSARDLVSIPGLGRSPGEGNGNPLQYSCLENSMDRGAQQATAHKVAKKDRKIPTPFELCTKPPYTSYFGRFIAMVLYNKDRSTPHQNMKYRFKMRKESDTSS